MRLTVNKSDLVGATTKELSQKAHNSLVSGTVKAALGTLAVMGGVTAAVTAAPVVGMAVTVAGGAMLADSARDGVNHGRYVEARMNSRLNNKR